MSSCLFCCLKVQFLKMWVDFFHETFSKNFIVLQVLLGLLEMCCEADWWVPSSKYGLPLTAAGDSCRTSRLALTSIARVRPAVFITSISKEIARYNNLGNFTIFTLLQFHEFFLDSCRTSRLALTSIARVRPAVSSRPFPKRLPA